MSEARNDDVREIERALVRIEGLVLHHDLRVKEHVDNLRALADDQRESSASIREGMDRMAFHLERIEGLLAKLANGGGNRLLWFLSAAVVVASLGSRALEFLATYLKIG